jgi:hypothetical protein
MQINEFIEQTILRPRLRRRGCLVVYDPERRYRSVCQKLAAEGVKVVDATESSLEGRGSALSALRNLGAKHGKGDEGLVVYVPSRKPSTPESMQRDPFALYMTCGEVFPEDDADEFLNLCLRAKPDHATAIRQLFEANPSPTFEMIDSVGGGASWPQLKTLLAVDSARDILFALLAPTKAQLEALKGSDAWAQEAKDLFAASFGCSLRTKGRTHSPISDEMWQTVLFSEFAFDLPAELPARLAGVTRAAREARPLVDDLCDRLRNDNRSRTTYVERAMGIERDMGLADACADLDDLGRRDTFLFEERTHFYKSAAALRAEKLDEVREPLARYGQSVWVSVGESQSQWAAMEAALELVEQCGDFERQLPDNARSMAALLDFYTGALREVDRAHREFEQAVAGLILEPGPVQEVVAHARGKYGRLAELMQQAFMRHLEQSTWPVMGRLSNADVFERFVAPALKQSGTRIAYMHVDALRFELGVALEKLLSEDAPVAISAALAQLPTITPVGMASLLPDAGTTLRLANDGGALVPYLGGVPVATVPQRMDAFRRRLGARFMEMRLGEFVQRSEVIPKEVDLLVLRSVEIDSQLENDPQETIGLLPKQLSRIRVAVNKLRAQGFASVVIASDHGFHLNGAAGAGDVCMKPSGTWDYVAHDRMMLGHGQSDAHNVVLPSDKLGMRGDFAAAAMPRSLAPYSRGHLYFHGGASLQECVVPVLTLKLEAAVPEPRKVTVTLSYKSGAKKVFTRRPVLEVIWATTDMFEQDRTLEILLEAHDVKGEVVGEPRGSMVDAASGLIHLQPNVRLSVPLKMSDEFEGRMTVKVLNPQTLVAYQTLVLDTEYNV